MTRTALALKEQEWSEERPAQRRRRGRGYGDAAVIAACERVIDIFSGLFGISSRELRARGRCEIAVGRTRHIAMYVAHVTLGMTMSEVGIGFNRDRTTVVYACHLVEDLRDDVEFDRLVAMAERLVATALGGQP